MIRLRHSLFNINDDAVRKACSVFRFRLCRYLSHCSLFSTHNEPLRAIRLGAYRIRLDKWYIKQARKGQFEICDANEREALAKDRQPKTRVPKSISTFGLVSVPPVRYSWKFLLNSLPAFQLMMVQLFTLLHSRSGIWFLRGMPRYLSLPHKTLCRLHQVASSVEQAQFMKKQPLMTFQLQLPLGSRANWCHGRWRQVGLRDEQIREGYQALYHVFFW